MHIPISACLIVKNDPAIERAVASIRPFVDEVCIVDTGSTDGTAEIAKRIADRFESFTDCNFEDGEIADFSLARSRSFAIASHETVIWLDSDDVVRGAEHLQEAIAWCLSEANGQPFRALFPYEYDRDEKSQVITLQPRERIVHPKSAFHWRYRVHEGLTAIQANEWRTLTPPTDAFPVVWDHRIDKSKPRSRRNVRILRDVVKQAGGPDHVDTKTMFDLGMDLAKAGEQLSAMGWLSRFVGSSDLDDQRMLACMQIVDILAYWPGREQDAAIWAHRAVEIKSDAPDGYFALAKLSYTQASRATDARAEQRHLKRVEHFARKGLALPEWQSLAASNPLDGRLNVPWMLHDALHRLGDTVGALDAMRTCARARPGDVEAALRLRESELRAGAISFSGPDVVIVCGQTQESWDPATAASRGIGGSETAVIEMGKRLSSRGCRVRVYAQVETAGLYDGVEYRSMGSAHEAAGCDVLIAWRNATLLETTPARCKWLWLHDTEAVGASPWNLALADRILCLSQWHCDHVARLYPEHANKITKTRNGIDLARFEQTVERHPHRAIYSSSWDRGLEQLLDMWPEIRAHAPDAELHVFYGSAGLPQSYRDMMVARMAESPSVVLRDRVDQKTLAREMLAAGAWLYPSWAYGKPFTETSCISAMEAQAAGVRPVCLGAGALPETVLSGCWAFSEVPASKATTFELYKESFIYGAVSALCGASSRDEMQAEARRAFSWDGVADQWIALLSEDAAKSAAGTGQADDGRPVLHMILAPQASGNVVMDARNPGGEAMGGGSRVGFLGLVREMGKRGEYRVRAFSTFKDALVVKDGVEYCRLDMMTGYPDPDVAFAFYDTSPLAAIGPNTLRIASHHTYAPYMHFDSADLNTAPSQHAVDALRRDYDPTGTWHVLPNGCDAPSLERAPVPGRIIYHTSPDRGLDLLFEAYVLIKKRVPHATLHVVGDVHGYIESARTGPERFRPRAERMQKALAAAEAAGGVKLLGRLQRADLNRELAEASCFAFPCAPVAPCETFSLSIMECCALGLPVVLVPADALESIYRDAALIVHGPAKDCVAPFAAAVADVLTDTQLAEQLSLSGQALAKRFTFAREADVLTALIREARQGAMRDIAAE